MYVVLEMYARCSHYCDTGCVYLCVLLPVHSTLEGRVIVLPEQPLPPLPLNYLACPHTIRSSAAATEGSLSSGVCKLNSNLCFVAWPHFVGLYPFSPFLFESK